MPVSEMEKAQLEWEEELGRRVCAAVMSMHFRVNPDYYRKQHMSNDRAIGSYWREEGKRLHQKVIDGFVDSVCAQDATNS